MNNIVLKIKEFFSKRKRIAVAALCFVILLLVILILIFGNHNKRKFALNEIYEVFPEDVKKLYSNIVEVSCSGDLHFDIELNSGKKKIEDINKNDLINYMFSYLDKNGLLTDNIEKSLINKTIGELFAEKVDLIDEIKDYSYGNYTYNYSKDNIGREKSECKSDIKYVSHLFGYSYNKNELSIDVNVAYLNDGILYNFEDEKLGEYNGEASKLFELTKNTSYYRLNYIKRKGIYKLSSIEWKSRT